MADLAETGELPHGTPVTADIPQRQWLELRQDGALVPTDSTFPDGVFLGGEPFGLHPELAFGDIAEHIRPISEQLDGAWKAVDQTKRAGLERLQATVQSIVLDPLKDMLEGDTGRRMKKAIGIVRGDRAHQHLVDGMALVVHNGVREHAIDGTEPALPRLYRYADARRFVGAYTDALGINTPLSAYITSDVVAAGQGQIDTVMDETTDELFGHYGQIYQTAIPLVATTADYFRQGLDQAQSFADWLGGVAEEQDGDYRAYLQMLAADMLNKDGRSFVGDALNELETGEGVALQGEFVASLLAGEVAAADEQTMQWLTLLRKTASRGGEELADEDFRELLVTLEADWPDMLKGAYSTYAQQRTRTVADTVRDVLASYAVKSRQAPNRKAVDTILISDVKSQQDHAKASRNRGKGRGNRPGRVTLPLRDVIPAVEPEPRPSTVAVLKQVPEGYYFETEGAEESVSKMIDRYCQAYPSEASLGTVLHELIDQVLADPFGPGTKNMTDMDVKVGGRVYHLRRATVRRNAAATSSGNTAYRTRLVYAVSPASNGHDNTVVAVREVIHHNDFDKKYTSS